MGFLGIICGLQMEADCFADIEYSDKIRIAVSAAKPDRAEAEARQFALEGARGLISFGLCGGLDPKLKAGDLVAPNQIIANQDMWGISPFLIGRSVVQAEFGLGSDRVVPDVEEKASLHRSTGSAIVDMESHRIGAVCSACNIPFFVLRAVCDPADQSIPAAAAHAIDDRGKTRPMAVAAGLIRNPGDFADLMRLKKQTETALATLRNAASKEVPGILRSVELI